MDREKLLIRDARTISTELVMLYLGSDLHEWIAFEKRYSRIIHRNNVSVHECSELARSMISRRTAPNVLIDLAFAALYNLFTQTAGAIPNDTGSENGGNENEPD